MRLIVFTCLFAFSVNTPVAASGEPEDVIPKCEEAYVAAPQQAQKPAPLFTLRRLLIGVGIAALPFAGYQGIKVEVQRDKTAKAFVTAPVPVEKSLRQFIADNKAVAGRALRMRLSPWQSFYADERNKERFGAPPRSWSGEDMGVYLQRWDIITDGLVSRSMEAHGIDPEFMRDRRRQYDFFLNYSHTGDPITAYMNPLARRRIHAFDDVLADLMQWGAEQYPQASSVEDLLKVLVPRKNYDAYGYRPRIPLENLHTEADLQEGTDILAKYLPKILDKEGFERVGLTVDDSFNPGDKEVYDALYKWIFAQAQDAMLTDKSDEIVVAANGLEYRVDEFAHMIWLLLQDGAELRR